MRARFLLGRAGSGKTYTCIGEVRAALRADPEGPPLIFLAPKQATFQLERQLLIEGEVSGYTRLSILSFERLAQFALEQLGRPVNTILSEQGRTMALRALLSRRRGQLQIFRSSSGLARFAQTLSDELRSWQRRQFTPAGLMRLSERPEFTQPLRRKVHDLGVLLGDYLQWLAERGAQDPDCLLELATCALDNAPAGSVPIAALWMDGFAEMSAQELSLLAAICRHCDAVTLAFCLDPQADASSALSIWSTLNQTRQECWTRLHRIPGSELAEQILSGARSRFSSNPALDHLEKHWTFPRAIGDGAVCGGTAPIRFVSCPTAESEAIFAAQEILRLVRDRGGRFREAAVLVRKLEGYGEHLRRVFARYEIPFFLDRRESASHHPLAELTRGALRAAAFDWAHDDWFGALKTGLVAGDANAVDSLENEALRRGWKGEAWFKPLPGEDVADAERLRKKWIAPFARFRAALNSGDLFNPAGADVAAAIRELWGDLRVEQRMEEWSEKEPFHRTVWEQLNVLLDDIENAFGRESLGLREWLAIIEAGLAGLTIGVVPPALDQVLIGAVDRSRNPELKLALVLGVNETVFPAPPRSDSLLSEAEREEIRACGLQAGPTRLQLLGREHFLGYIACTRSAERLALTCAERVATGEPLNPSPLLAHARKLFPALELEKFAGPDWRNAERACELVDHIAAQKSLPARLQTMLTRPAFALLREQLNFLSAAQPEEVADLAEALYGPALKTSVSRLEDYAACAFKFFVRSGLHAEERQIFELDVRERGSFQHAVLAAFDDGLRAEGKRWRDLTPDEGRQRLVAVAESLASQFRDGLLSSNPQARFSARTVAETLAEFVAATIDWMRHYEFDPAAVELAFGREGAKLPAWEIDLGGGRRIQFRGIIDRIDLCRTRGAESALAIVVDYKSGARKLEEILMEHGLQLQLAAYLAVLRRLDSPREIFGVDRLIPAGMFYVNLRGQGGRGATRTEVLRDRDAARQSVFQHVGRFDFSRLAQLDKSGAGTQFNYKVTRSGRPHKANRDCMESAEFLQLLDDVEAQLRRMGREIYAGAIHPNPFQRGQQRACDHCECQAVCRFDGWSDSFRQLVDRKVKAG